MKSATGNEEVPALRNSKLVHTFDRRGGQWVVVHSDYYKRYGGKRELILRDVLAGDHEVPELREKYGAKTGGPGRFFETWIKPMIDDGVLVGDSGIVGAAPDWRAALERVRRRTDEDEDNRRQSEKYAERRRKYLQAKDTPAERTPHLPGKEKNRQTFRNMEERDEAARIEAQRTKVGVTAEVFVHDTLERLGRASMGLLRELWAEKGGNPSHVWLAVRRIGCKLERMAEYDNSLVVHPPEVSKPGAEPESVTPLPRPRSNGHATTPRDQGELVIVTPIHPSGLATAPDPEEWRDHPLDCECLDCSCPPRSYARPYRREEPHYA